MGPVVLELDGEERRVAARVICDVDEARPVDWVLLATKAQQTPQAGPWLARLCRPGTVGWIGFAWFVGQTTRPSLSSSGYASRGHS